MGVSKLATINVPASTSNYSKGRSGYKICKFTPHHMAGVLSAKRCGELFQNPKRGASSHYGIGNDGTIACYVDEDNRTWTSSSKNNDCQAITVEVSNCKTGGEWPISEAAWNSLVELAVDVCRRHNFRLEYTGTKTGSLTCHKMFVPTACPGTYLEKRLPELARIVNARLDGNVELKEPNGYIVKVNTDILNIREDAGTNYDIVGTIEDKGIYTIIAEKHGNGANMWGKLKSGAGWISLDYVEKQSSGDVVIEPSGGITKGSKVKFVGTKGYNGETLAYWVRGSIFDVISISGNRVVIGKGKSITAAVKKSDLMIV